MIQNTTEKQSAGSGVDQQLLVSPNLIQELMSQGADKITELQNDNRRLKLGIRSFVTAYRLGGDADPLVDELAEYISCFKG